MLRLSEKEWAEKGSAFVEWTNPNNTIDWPEALKKLENPTYYYKIITRDENCPDSNLGVNSAACHTSN
jgi:hypothetical protein